MTEKWPQGGAEDVAAPRSIDTTVAHQARIILQLIPDADDPHAIVARLLEAVPPGSWLDHLLAATLLAEP